MKYNSVKSIYFSPTGSTKIVVQRISKYFDKNVEAYDILQNSNCTLEKIESDTLFIIGMPVFSGRIPDICVKNLERLKGNNTPVIAVVVYGNRDYEDALLELTDILKKNNFLVFAAGAFIAQHSIFHKVAKNRPDQKDIECINKFSEKCLIKLNKITNTAKSVSVKGNYPYRIVTKIPLIPISNKNCTSCGICSRVCPTKSISMAPPFKKNKNICISCAACIAACPSRSLSFKGILYSLISILFSIKYCKRSEPEYFL